MQEALRIASLTSTHKIFLEMDQGDKYSFDLKGSGKGVRVAVIDSGWSVNHPPPPSLRQGVSFTSRRGGSESSAALTHDFTGHGTVCSDILLRVARDALLYPVKIFEHTIETGPQRLVAALEWAIQNEMSVVNLSLSTLREDAVRYLYTACYRAERAGVTLVAANFES